MKKYLSLVAIFLVFGCAETMTSKVTTFNDNIAPSGKSYYIEPTAEQKKDLSFKMYSSYVIDALAKYNYTSVVSAKKADYIVNISYGIDNPITEFTSNEDVTRSSTYYTSFFKITFLDKKSMEPIYNSDAKTYTARNNFINSSKCVIDAAFINFPNPNQSIRNRAIKTDDCYFEDKEEYKSITDYLSLDLFS